MHTQKPHGPTLSTEAVIELQLRILDTFTEVCEGHSLAYFAYYGTLLGCVRHGGYIPWDDDIDIAMPRADYQRLREVDWAAVGLRLVDRSTSPRYPFAFAKLCDDSTLVIEGLAGRFTGWGGVNIDIWPIDRLPRTAIGRFANDLVVRALKQIILSKMLPRRPGRAWWRQASLDILRTLSAPVRMGWLLRSMEALIVGQKGDLMGCRLGGRGAEQWFPASYFTESVELDFAQRRLKAPRKYDAILKSLYGDYMTPPAEADQVSNHSFVAYRID